MPRHVPVRDFGFDPDESHYHFAVLVQRDADGVEIEERLSWRPDPSAEAPRAPITKAKLDAYRWSRIADVLRAEFNRRLRASGVRPASWRERETMLAPHLGKELTLLAWVIEDADPTVIPNMVANWRGLAPEERWWLYTTVNATAGHPEHGRDRGWRKAIKIALAENPAVAVTPGTVFITETEARRPDPDQRRPRPRRRIAAAAAPGTDQLTLLTEEEP